MESMVERMARAMEPRAFATYDRGYTCQNYIAERSFLSAKRTVKAARRKAKRAIEAMREPTEEMCKAAQEEDRLGWSPEPGEGRDYNAAAEGYIWVAMIDAALAGTAKE